MTIRKIAALLLLLSCASANVCAEELAVVARLYSREGTVETIRHPGKNWQNASDGQEFRLGDAVRVGKHGRAAILFVDGTLVRLSNNASIVFEGAVGARNEQTSINLPKGTLHLFSRESRPHPTVVTPIITAAIHGTEFVITARPDAADIAVLKGAVEGSNAWGSATARDSETITAVKGKPPVRGLLIDPAGAVQWTLQLPEVITLEDLAEFETGANARQKEGRLSLQRGDAAKAAQLFSGSDWRDTLGRSYASQLSGDNAAALEHLEAWRGAAPASFSLYAASLHLAFGETAEAAAMLVAAAKALEAAPPASQARLRAAIAAQQAVVALARNKRDEARRLSADAVAHDPGSPAAAVARSYVHQADFDLEQARKDLLAHAQNGNAGILLRLAEVELAGHDVRAAERYTAEALSRNPESAYGRTLQGFIELFKSNEDDAGASFEKALAADSSSALAHLGRGLVLVRQNDLESGRAELEKAVHLAPTVSLYRSYLGKAFFEQDDEQLAGEEYDLAMQLDPEDPTPYLYRAFNRLSQNQAVGALQDVEASIERNGNRAVYRSELLLDRDLATRTANLAQVFNELGFSQAARVEAIKSINQDYSNYSAHRLLAESYQSILLGRARFSESQISNLLAPLSFNLLGSTASDISLNEYTALFDKMEHRTAINLLGETYDDILLGQVYQTGREGDFGYLLGAEAGSQNGSKDNNYLRDNRLRLAGQYQIDFENRLVVDGSWLYRSERWNAQDEPATEKFDGADVNLGFNHRIDPQSTLLAQVSYFKDHDRYSDLDVRDAAVEATSSLAEPWLFDDQLVLDLQAHDDVEQVQPSLQHVYDSRWFSTVTGYEHIFSSVERWEDSPILYDIPAGIFPNLGAGVASRADYDLNSDSVYAYLIGHAAPWADVTGGLSYTMIEFEKTDVPTYLDETFDRDDLNVKAGLTLYPIENLTLRGAYFQGAAVSAVENLRTLEPTLVGGINQFYTDLAGTTSDNYGAGIDYKIPGESYFGAEYVRRVLHTKSAYGSLGYVFDFEGSQSSSSVTAEDFLQDRRQDLVSGYFYQVLCKELVGTLDYLYHREELDVDFEQEIQRHTAAAGLRYFLPNNIFTFARGVWRQQDQQGSFFLPDGVDSFWTLDLGVGYRIPDRHGALTLELLNVTDEEFAIDQSLGFEEYIPSGIGGRLTASINF